MLGAIYLPIAKESRTHNGLKRYFCPSHRYSPSPYESMTRSRCLDMNKTLCFKLAKQPSLTGLRAEKGGFERSYIDISQAKNVILCRRAAVEGDMSSALLGYIKLTENDK